MSDSSRRRLLRGLTASFAAVALSGRSARAHADPWARNEEPLAAAAMAPTNVWAAIREGLADAVASLPPRVYVPHEIGGDVAVIDPMTFQVIDRFSAGRVPHHVTPSHDLSRLYIGVMDSNRLLEIDPAAGRPVRSFPVVAPYNLYFPPDGSVAIVAAERFNRLDFYDPATWRVVARLPLPASGIDHLDFSADGSHLLVSAEFDGHVVKVDLSGPVPSYVGRLRVGGLPIDIKLAPEGDVFYVANQGRHGVSLVDAEAMAEIGFIPTALGAHGLAISRDTRSLYVSNRRAGSISVVDFAERQVVDTWRIGGSPDMLQVSIDGSELWVSGRWHGSVDVLDTSTGALKARIRTGSAPHGLTYFPQPGRFCLGHNGVYR